MTSTPKFLKIIIFIIYLTAFISVCLFVNTQMDRYDYFIYLYGESTAPGSKALVKVLSSDGELVSSPVVYVNGEKQTSSLITLRPDLKEIKVTFGTAEVLFPVKFRDISNSHFVPQKERHLTPQEEKKENKPVFLDGKEFYILPENFRAVSEFETLTALFCVENDNPCEDSTIFINGAEYRMNQGFVKFRTTFQKEQNINISLENGNSAVVPVPFSGKMFKFFKTHGRLGLSSLADVKGVHVDCLNQGKWVGTDVISLGYEGITLPETYSGCDTVQVSLNSASPGTMNAVYSTARTLNGAIDDIYYSKLAKTLPKFDNSAQLFFITSYNCSFFRPLSMIFSGEKLKNDFMEAKKSELLLYETILIASSLLGMILFVYIMIKRIKVVVDDDGEIISRSLNQQRAMIFGAAVFYAAFILSLLYLLNHLA